MKTLTAIIIALAMPWLLSAQSKFEKSYPIGNSSTISLDFQYGDITIEQHNGSELIVSGDVLINGEPKIEKFSFTGEQVGDRFIFTSESDLSDEDHRMTIVLNDGTKIFKTGEKFDWNNPPNMEGVDKVYNGVDVDATFTIKVPASVQLEVETTYGDVKVTDYWKGMNLHSTYGSVDIVLQNSPASPDFKAKSTYSDVDLTIPESIDAKLRLRTGYGKIFTNMNFQPDKKARGEGCEFGEDISATLNKGNGSIVLDATYSNVYLRRATGS